MSLARSPHNQRLDCLPLAIELAAAKVKVLSTEQISTRLDDCFRLLGTDSILRNSIADNEDLGIDLGSAEFGDGVTPNDPKDSDTGANGLQNFPVMTSVAPTRGQTTIEGKLNSKPDRTFTIQFFSNPVGGEGKKFVGQKSVTTNSNGNVSFEFQPAQAVPTGQTVTATATNSGGNTSEFSAPEPAA